MVILPPPLSNAYLLPLHYPSPSFKTQHNSKPVLCCLMGLLPLDSKLFLSIICTRYVAQSCPSTGFTTHQTSPTRRRNPTRAGSTVQGPVNFKHLSTCLVIRADLFWVVLHLVLDKFIFLFTQSVFTKQLLHTLCKASGFQKLIRYKLDL